MKFLLDDDQRQLQAAVRTYALEASDAGARRVSFESGSPDTAFLQSLAELGVLGIALPAAHGGMGLGLVELALAAEALGYAAAPGPFIGQALAGLALAWFGTEEQQARWLPGIAAGTTVATVALAERGGGIEPARWSVRHRDGRLTGEKRQVPGADTAALIVVGLADGFALVEHNARGLKISGSDHADRTRPLADLTLTDTPTTLMTGDPQRLLDAAAILVAADAFGGATRLLEMTVDYAKTREQFGVPIGSFQALKHQLADMAVEVEPSHGLYWYAAYAFDRGVPEASRIASVAKAHLGDMFMQAARRAVEAHGGIGYTWEHDAQIWFKRAMFDFAWLGVPAAHRDRVARLAGWGAPREAGA